MNFERPNHSSMEDEIRREGAEKGWSDTEIDAKILSEKAKAEKVEFESMQKDAQKRAEKVLDNEKLKDIGRLYEVAQSPVDDLQKEFEEMSRKSQEIGKDKEEAA